VSEQDSPASGSRWEPADGASHHGRSALADAGVGLVLAGGLGGFAVGRAIAGTDGWPPRVSTGADQNGAPDGGRGVRPPFHRDGTGQDGRGTLPGGSSPHGSPSPGHGDGGTA
jgi:hypothetical protein